MFIADHKNKLNFFLFLRKDKKNNDHVPALEKPASIEHGAEIEKCSITKL